jgi:hypothetical protein
VSPVAKRVDHDCEVRYTPIPVEAEDVVLKFAVRKAKTAELFYVTAGSRQGV